MAYSTESGFPITPLLPAIRASLREHPRLVLEAPPGAGKTTQVPPALLDEPWLQGRKIILLEPRRIAARAAAEFMASALDEAVGQTVGYRIRFESRVSANTRIEVVTEGILTRMLQDDPELPGIGAIAFDEFHERHLHGDLGAALALDVQASLRPDLRLAIMSATLEGERVARWIDAPVIRSEGRAFPMRIEHPPRRRGEDESSHLRRAVEQALQETDGDVLVFLPGRREIARTQRMLNDVFSGSDPFPRERGKVPKGWVGAGANPASPIEVLPLHGELSLAEQHAALNPSEPGTRRVILATNVAESSVTLPGIRAVVDAGLAREPRFDPNSGFARLQIVSISQASADQRAGRAGRTAPGAAYRLWPQSQRLEPSRTPEIAQAELSSLALDLAAWGIGEDAQSALRWLDPPPPGALAQARDLLQRLSAVDETLRITKLGRAMLKLGAQPRLAAAALRGPETQRALIADLLALLEARSPLRGGFNDDLRAQLAALHVWRDGGTRVQGADAGALTAIEHSARGWRKRLEVRTAASGVPDALAVGNLLLHAFPDRAAKQDDRDPRRYLLASGRGARLHEESALLGEAWLVIVEARFDARDSLVLNATPFDPALLARDFPHRFASGRVLRWNEPREVVEAFEEERFDAIVLSRRSVPVTPADALPALLAHIRTRGLQVLSWSEAAQRLRARVAWLRTIMAPTDLPDVSDQALLDSMEQWLAPTLHGKRKLDALSPSELSDALVSLLDWPQRKLLDEHAPDAITVPSGMSRRIEYTSEGPVLAVKLQELFGLADTPRVANGRVPVTLQLLSPGGRPIQVTQDLRSFWERTYPEVKRELKGRYPKHPWPDDPWTATPTHRAKPRS
jgi:ATP-dependent helicase HrpB